MLFSRLSIFHKMLAAPTLALLLFMLYMGYVHLKQQSSRQDLVRIQNIHFPILALANENIILLESINKSFEDAIGAKEKVWLDKTFELKKSIEKNLASLKKLTPAPLNDKIAPIEESFLDYFVLAFEFSSIIIEETNRIERLESISALMPEVTKECKMRFAEFKEQQQNSFTTTIESINNRQESVLLIGLVLGITSLLFILYIMIALSFNTRRSIGELLKSITDMADGNPDFTHRLSQDGNDELSALAKQFNRFTQKLENDYKELKRAKQEVETANRIKGEFLANVSHEIRTPLNAVIGFSELMEQTEITKKQSEYLHLIKTGGRALLSLINDILDLSKLEAHKMSIQPEPIQLGSLLRDVCNIFEPKADEKHLEIRLNIDPLMPKTVMLDETRVRQVLFNLIGNAIKFTDRGWIEVRAYSQKCQECEGSINLFLEVEDSGIGIPDEQHALIFESFRQQAAQSNRKYGGTGLGLTISLKLIEMMGGTLTLKSSVGKGSLFSIYIKNVAIYTTQNDNIENIIYKDLAAKNREDVLVFAVDEIAILKTNQTIKELLNRAVKSGMFHDIDSFCEAIMEFAHEKELIATAIYAKELKASIERFDTALIERRLKQLSESLSKE